MLVVVRFIRAMSVTVRVVALLGMDMVVFAGDHLGLHLARLLPNRDRTQDHQYQHADPAVKYRFVEPVGEESESIGAVHLDRGKTQEAADQDRQQLLGKVIARRLTMMMVMVMRLVAMMIVIMVMVVIVMVHEQFSCG
jgi:hypothetical protein